MSEESPEKFNNSNFNEISQELPPEVIEKVMEKVVNINEYGTAYTGITEENMPDILINGLLGTAGPHTELMENMDHERAKNRFDPSVWAENSRTTRQTEVHINILGRSIGATDSTVRTAISKGEFAERFPIISEEYGTLQLIVDVSSFREKEPVYFEGEKDYDTMKERKGESHTYRVAAPKNHIDLNPDQHGNIGVTDEYGFSVSYRIAPHYFRGLVISEPKQLSEVIAIMRQVYADEPAKCLPIYSRGGNLLWPKKMNNSEILELIKAQ
jgi:hypothetical protein